MSHNSRFRFVSKHKRKRGESSSDDSNKNKLYWESFIQFWAAETDSYDNDDWGGQAEPLGIANLREIQQHFVVLDREYQ